MLSRTYLAIRVKIRQIRRDPALGAACSSSAGITAKVSCFSCHHLETDLLCVFSLPESGELHPKEKP